MLDAPWSRNSLAPSWCTPRTAHTGWVRDERCCLGAAVAMFAAGHTHSCKVSWGQASHSYGTRKGGETSCRRDVLPPQPSSVIQEGAHIPPVAGTPPLPPPSLSPQYRSLLHQSFNMGAHLGKQTQKLPIVRAEIMPALCCLEHASLHDQHPTRRRCAVHERVQTALGRAAQINSQGRWWE